MFLILSNTKIEFEKNLDFIFNRKIFILPFHRDIYKVGATYDWHHINTHPTEKAKIYLEKKLNQFLSVNFKTIDHLAGIRPATRDRRPFIGLHPDLKTVGIFNGFGSKGVSLVPLMAHMYVDYLLNGKELEIDVNIKAYFN